MTTRIDAVARAAAMLGLFAFPAHAQTDPGVRGGIQNTAGMLQYNAMWPYLDTGRVPQRPPIPHPPLISPHPVTGATANPNEVASFLEGINRAGQLESTCDNCAMVPDGSLATIANGAPAPEMD